MNVILCHMIDQLPFDISEKIVSHMDPVDVASACLVNKSWNQTMKTFFPRKIPTMKDIITDLAVRESGEFGILEDMGLGQWFCAIHTVAKYSFTWLLGILHVPRDKRITMHMSFTRAKEFFGLSQNDIGGLCPSRYCRSFYQRAFAAYDIYSLAGLAIMKHGGFQKFQEWNRKKLEQKSSRKRAIDIVRTFQQNNIPLECLEDFDCYRFIHENQGSLETIVRRKKMCL